MYGYFVDQTIVVLSNALQYYEVLRLSKHQPLYDLHYQNPKSER